MIIARGLPLFLSVLAAVTACLPLHLSAQNTKDTAEFAGKPLGHWVAQATAENGPSDLDATVAALIEAVQSDDPNAKRDTGDALAALGPKAKEALPALLGQFGHEFPWVRVSCQAAVGAMGAAERLELTAVTASAVAGVVGGEWPVEVRSRLPAG